MSSNIYLSEKGNGNGNGNGNSAVRQSVCSYKHTMMRQAGFYSIVICML